MGNNQADLSQTDFKKNWRVRDSIDQLVIWQNIENPDSQLEQYLIRNDNSNHFQELYKLRQGNPYLVNAYALRNEQGFCGANRDQKKIFIERIPVRLSNIKDVPYPSLLHLYDAAIHGFNELTTVLGFFHIDEDQIGINDFGQVKVWCNPAFQRSQPVSIQRISEEEMLYEMFGVIGASVDRTTYPQGQISFAQYLYEPTPCVSFFEARNKFVNYMRLYNHSEVPANMHCVPEVGGAETINNWCRSHSSYGFERSTLRLAEKLRQSKTSILPYENTSNQQSNQTSIALVKLEPTIETFPSQNIVSRQTRQLESPTKTREEIQPAAINPEVNNVENKQIKSQVYIQKIVPLQPLPPQPLPQQSLPPQSPRHFHPYQRQIVLPISATVLPLFSQQILMRPIHAESRVVQSPRSSKYATYTQYQPAASSRVSRQPVAIDNTESILQWKPVQNNENLPYASSLQNKIFSPSADGRSSPEFLALMCQLPTYSKYHPSNSSYLSGLHSTAKNEEYNPKPIYNNHDNGFNYDNGTYEIADPETQTDTQKYH